LALNHILKCLTAVRDGENIAFHRATWINNFWESKQFTTSLTLIGSELRLVDEVVGHYHFASDIECLILRAGFAIDHIYGGHRLEPYDPQTSEDIIVVAHKT